MNAVEIEEAISELAAAPFDAAEFPYAFLAAFGNKETTIKRLRAGSTNTSDVPGGVLQRNNIHIAVCTPGGVRDAVVALRASEKTTKGKVKFVLATDGIDFEAEDLSNGEPVTDVFGRLAYHFGFFLPLAGISTVSEIKNNPIDIKATSRLNKLYVELLSHNKDWSSDARRQDLNQFMARLIFCFFAEDTGIILQNSFTACLEQMTDSQSGNTHEVIQELFRTMDTPVDQRAAKGVKTWADKFPYVNGGLFTAQTDCPRFSRMARSYLLRAGELDWKQINPDIFGSMIQAVADDEERGELGMHYTSVPNILKVLNPLFLDELREQLEQAGDNARKLLNLRKRIAAIRVVDPACGSGNFLVIAYIKLRELEAEIIARRKDTDQKSWIPLTNFYGIELKSFAAEIARLALLIAEFQCNVRHIGQREACLDVLPLHDTGRIVTGNALRLDWLEVCPPATKRVDYRPSTNGGADEPGAGSAVAETYICGNPPYVGSKWQSRDQKIDLAAVFQASSANFKTLDYVAAWVMKAAIYSARTNTHFAFVTTNSICQGEQVALLWPEIFKLEMQILFAHRSFKWQNLASNNAGVTCVIVGVGRHCVRQKVLFEGDTTRRVSSLGPYLLEMGEAVVHKSSNPVSTLSNMQYGNHPYYGADLIMSRTEANQILGASPDAGKFFRPLFGSQEYINNSPRVCVWVEDHDAESASAIPELRSRFDLVRQRRNGVKNDHAASALAARPYRFRDQTVGKTHVIIVPRVSSESRPFLPVGLLDGRCILQDQAIALYDAPLWNMALIASRLHLVWIATVCGKMKTDFRYSNTLGWNTFPVPPLTENQKAELTRCAEDILLAREAHFPATIADLYDPEAMPEDLRRAHDRNDETLERIYIGRRFKNDTERLEKLFDLYAQMTATKAAQDTSAPKPAKAKPAKAKAPKAKKSEAPPA